MPKYESIPAFEETKKRVDGFGKKGETYDQILNRIMDIAERVQLVSKESKKN